LTALGLSWFVFALVEASIVGDTIVATALAGFSGLAGAVTIDTMSIDVLQINVFYIINQITAWWITIC
jgi:hypothetical protein